ncbi:MAG: hypothetical protein AAB546_00295 [Patescibacteria group bacterium]
MTEGIAIKSPKDLQRELDLERDRKELGLHIEPAQPTESKLPWEGKSKPGWNFDKRARGRQSYMASKGGEAVQSSNEVTDEVEGTV